MITIPVAHYNDLIDSDNTLALLNAAGVDNWEWYGDALRGEL